MRANYKPSTYLNTVFKARDQAYFCFRHLFFKGYFSCVPLEVDFSYSEAIWKVKWNLVCPGKLQWIKKTSKFHWGSGPKTYCLLCFVTWSIWEPSPLICLLSSAFSSSNCFLWGSVPSFFFCYSTTNGNLMMGKPRKSDLFLISLQITFREMLCCIYKERTFTWICILSIRCRVLYKMELSVMGGEKIKSPNNMNGKGLCFLTLKWKFRQDISDF